jgi:DNA-binding winged helix-turn-helix (wHTH) protein
VLVILEMLALRAPEMNLVSKHLLEKCSFMQDVWDESISFVQTLANWINSHLAGIAGL